MKCLYSIFCSKQSAKEPLIKITASVLPKSNRICIPYEIIFNSFEKTLNCMVCKTVILRVQGGGSKEKKLQKNRNLEANATPFMFCLFVYRSNCKKKI